MILQETLEKIKKSSKEIIDITLFKAKDIVVSDWAALKYQFGCEPYGKNRTCPPVTMKPDEFKKVLKEYSTALLIVGKSKTIAEQKSFVEAVLDVENMLLIMDYYKALALMSGPYRVLKRPEAAAFGVDFFATLKKLEKKIKVYARKQEYISYAIILLE